MMRSLSFSLALGLSCSLLVASASAQTNQAERAAAYQHGRDAMTAGNWRDAQKIFSDLWAQSHSYDVALSLGQVEINLEKYRDAAEHLAYGLRYLPAKEKPELEGKASRGLKFARQKVGAFRVSVEPGAIISVDARELGPAPLDGDVFVDPGEHFLEARLPNRQPAQEKASAKAGETTSVALVFSGPALISSAPPPGAPPVPVIPPVNSGLDAPQNPGTAPVEPRDSSVEPRTIAIWSGVGVTAVALGAGIGFALKGSSASNDAESLGSKLAPGACQLSANASSCSALRNALDRRNSSHEISGVSFIVAGVAAAATGAMFAFWHPRESEKSSAIQIVPVATQNTGGLILNGSF